MSLSKSPAVTLTHCTGAPRPAASVLSMKVPPKLVNSVGRAGLSDGHRPMPARLEIGAVEVTCR